MSGAFGGMMARRSCLFMCSLWKLVVILGASFVPTGAIVQSTSLRPSSQSAILSTTDVPRSLVLTNNACTRVRAQPFRAKLELTYFYFVETFQEGELNVEGLHQAIVHELMTTFSACDSQGRPIYAIDNRTNHVVSQEGHCLPLSEGNVCHVVVGITKMSFDREEAEAVQVMDTAYEAIRTALADTDTLRSYAPDVHSARFIRGIQEDLIVQQVPDQSEGSRSVLTVVASSTGAVALLLTAFLVCRVFRKTPNHSEQGIPSTPARMTPRSFLSPRSFFSVTPRDSTSPKPLGIKRVEDFDRMKEEEDSALFHVAFDPEEPSITWSVSDITSDSGSLRSMTPSRLDKIEEASCEEEEAAPSDEVTPSPRKEDEEDDEDVDSEGSVNHGRQLHSFRDRLDPMLSLWKPDLSNEKVEESSLEKKGQMPSELNTSGPIDDNPTNEPTVGTTNHANDDPLSLWQFISSSDEETSECQGERLISMNDDTPGSFHTAEYCDIEVTTVTSEDESTEHKTDQDYSAYDLHEVLFMSANEEEEKSDSSSLDLSAYTTDSECTELNSWLVSFLHKLSIAQRTPRLEY